MLFEYLDNIYYHNFAQFKSDIDTCRADMLSVDSQLLQERGIAIDIEKEFELSDGRLILEYKKIGFECFFHYKSNTTLFVFLNGALTQERPQFNRWSYYKFLNASVLNIADPMYQFYEDLELGWYYGNETFNLRIYVAELVKIIAEKLGVSNDQIIFYGSSGGGAAVLECASHIEGAKAVAINPQVVLEEYSYAETFEKITHNNLAEDSKWHRNNGIYFLKHNNSSKHLIMVNIRCKSDMKQIDNICKAMGLKLKYGLNFYHDLIIWLYDCECEPYIDAHNLQDNYCICFALKYLVEHSDNQETLEQCNSLYRYTSEWWYAWWRQELYWYSRIKQPNLFYLVECTRMLKKIALFGTGDEAKRLSKELLDIDGENYYRIKAIFDNNKNKSGKFFYGIMITHPDTIEKWSDFFIIITTSKYVTDIEKQLESYGLVYKNDFIRYTDLYKNV